MTIQVDTYVYYLIFFFFRSVSLSNNCISEVRWNSNVLNHHDNNRHLKFQCSLLEIKHDVCLIFIEGLFIVTITVIRFRLCVFKTPGSWLRFESYTFCYQILWLCGGLSCTGCSRLWHHCNVISQTHSAISVIIFLAILSDSFIVVLLAFGTLCFCTSWFWTSWFFPME